MKNFAWAVGILAVVIIFIFLYSTKQLSGRDTFIPTPQPVGSPQLEFSKPKEATSNVNAAPFEILKPDQIEGKKVTIKTAQGDIVIELFSDAPLAASNFISLAGKKFYDGLTFHRREEGFVIQGGDPKGDGTGDPGYKFSDEPVTRDYQRGTVAMANSGPNTNGSQFFIMLRDAPLEKKYTIFGQVVSGMDVVDGIQVGDKMLEVKTL